jgi:radical SAM superfamily enzyme YgiQ (UPF0313 family)
MKVLLIYAPYKYPNNQTFKSEPLGILYIAANLKKHGYDVKIYDATINAPVKCSDGLYYYGGTAEEIKDVIKSYNPDVVGISCNYSYCSEETLKLASIIKNINSDIKIIIGGLVPTIYKEKVLQDCNDIDFGLIGESESSFLDLLSSGLINPENIDGLIYRKGNDIITNKKCKFIENLDNLPYPARDLADIKKYMNCKTQLYGLGDKPALSLLTSRSCPNQCTFCNMWLVHGKKWRPRSPENVLCELDEMVNKYKAEHIFVIDDNFTFDTQRAKTICEMIIQKKYNFSWNTPNGISPKTMDLELAKLMKRSGCKSVCIAIESGSEHIRNDVMKKRVTNDHIMNCVNSLNKAGIPVGGFLILGMPGENEFHFKKTIEFVNKLPLSFIVVSFAVPFPGTKLYYDLISTGIIPDDFEIKIDTLARPTFETQDFNKNDLIKRKRQLMLSFYKNHIPQLFADFITGRSIVLNMSNLKQFYYNTLKLK